MPIRSLRRTCRCWPFRSSKTPAKCATRTCCRRFSICPGHRTSRPARSHCPGMPAGVRGRPAGAEARRRECGQAGLVGEVVALALRRGPHLRDYCLSARPKGWRRSRRWKPAAVTWNICGRPGTPRCRNAPFARTAGAGHGSGLFRCGGARTDAGSREAGRLPEHHAAGGTAGRFLRLDRAARRLARAGAGG